MSDRHKRKGYEPGRPKFTDDEMKRMIYLRYDKKHGLSYQDIASEVGCHRNTVARFFKWLDSKEE